MAAQWDIDFDYDNFEYELYQAGLQAFTEVQDLYDGETFFTFAFSTSEIYEAPGIEICTEERLYRRAMESHQEYHAEAGFTFDETLAYLRYNFLDYWETGLEYDDKPAFDRVLKMIHYEWQEQTVELEDHSLHQLKYYAFPDVDGYHQNRLEAVFLKVLNRLDMQRIFERTVDRSSVTLFFLRRGYFPEALQDRTMEMINPPEVVSRFHKERARIVKLYERKPW